MEFLQEVLKGLNDKQKQAVLHTDGPLLIIAGAGAGKTKTLTHRVLNLIVNGVNPHKILAITFTNKAAKEMKERVEDLIKASKSLNLPISHISLDTGMPFVSTFHSLGVYILKRESELLGLRKHFSIYDRSDSKSVVKNVLKELDYDPKQYEPGMILSLIGKAKSDMIRLDEYEADAESDYMKEVVSKVWRKYQKRLKDEDALDFDDLLYRAAFLLKDNKEIREKYQDRWDYIHIDEYQDTNEVQYQLVKMLGEKHQNVCVVGDADQNIYSWRGATIKNILHFEKDYPEAHEIVLEQNYRSTQNILSAANAVIKKNTRRIEKNLFTQNDEGDLLTLFNAYDEYDEADFVTKRAQELIDGGTNPNDIAVLYRTNFQSRVLEELFLQSKIPYQILGTRFFDRKEVKDVVAYLKYALNENDLTSLGRIINFPTRGIGKVGFLKICEGNAADLSGKAKANYVEFQKTIKTLQNKVETATPSEVIKFIFTETGIEEALHKDKEFGEERILNIQELVSLATRYDALEADSMEKFLEDISLLSDQDELDNKDAKKNGVKLMTVHASKGLEFDHVFVTGLEQGLFPSDGFDEDRDDEEERRLFYVAITRAKKKVYLTYASVRKIFGRGVVNVPSEFIDDIEDDYLEIFQNEERCDRGDTGSLAKDIFIDF
jgi:DNA helicase II / ATP-dependent DNA helicase PcrA